MAFLPIWISLFFYPLSATIVINNNSVGWGQFKDCNYMRCPVDGGVVSLNPGAVTTDDFIPVVLTIYIVINTQDT